MKPKPDIVMNQRLGPTRAEYPFIVELRTNERSEKADQTHRFSDSHSREEFVLGIRAAGRLLGLRVDENVEVKKKRRR